MQTYFALGLQINLFEQNFAKILPEVLPHFLHLIVINAKGH